MADKEMLDSLQRRIRAMHSLYHDAVATMDLEQVNHFEREGVLPIAFSLFHLVNMVDTSFMLMTGTIPIWNADWQDRVKMEIADHGTDPVTGEDLKALGFDPGPRFKEILEAVEEAQLSGEISTREEGVELVRRSFVKG